VRGEGVVRVDGITRDVTERKRLELELRRHAQELAESDQRKDEFLAMLAHELRNPLAPIVNAARLLELRSAVLPRELSWSVAVIARQAAQMRRLVDDMLDLARITRGRIDLHLEPVDLAEVVSGAVETARPLIEARGHHLELALPAGPVPLKADRVRLAQVLGNLLHNAAKYTPEHGQIRLSVEREGAEAVVRVRDNGVGIAPEMLPRVFDLFAQAERSLDRAEGGLGLGLKLVRTLVEMHGGSVDASSEGRGRGSEFVVRLPIVEAADARTAQGHDRCEPAPLARRVLVVDDHADVAQSLALLLRELGCEVAVAYDGEAALQSVRDFAPEVVFLDIGLPGIDGYEVARRLRKEGPGGLLLVALTGYGQEKDKARAREAGFDHHLLKPAELEAVEALLAGDRPPPSARERLVSGDAAAE
jgi:CheY-like chemotaxis protein